MVPCKNMYLLFCVAQRGIEDSSSYTITSKVGGSFKTNSTVRKEFMDLVR